MGAAEHDLRALGLTAHIIDVGPDAVADLEVLARDGLVAAHNAFTTAEVDNDIAILDALDRAIDHFGDAVLELFVLTLTFGFANLVGHDLTGHLGLDPAKFEGRQDFGIGLADRRFLIALQGVGQALLSIFVLDGAIGDHRHHAGNGHFAGAGVDMDADIVLSAITRARRLLDRLLDGFDHNFLFDRFLTRNGVSDLQEFKPVCGNAGDAH